MSLLGNNRRGDPMGDPLLLAGRLAGRDHYEDSVDYDVDPFEDLASSMDTPRHYGAGWGCSGLVQVDPHRVMVGNGPRAWLACCAGCGERFWGRSGEVVAEARRVHVNASAW